MIGGGGTGGVANEPRDSGGNGSNSFPVGAQNTPSPSAAVFENSTSYHIALDTMLTGDNM